MALQKNFHVLAHTLDIADVGQRHRDHLVVRLETNGIGDIGGGRSRPAAQKTEGKYHAEGHEDRHEADKGHLHLKHHGRTAGRGRTCRDKTFGSRTARRRAGHGRPMRQQQPDRQHQQGQRSGNESRCRDDTFLPRIHNLTKVRKKVYLYGQMNLKIMKKLLSIPLLLVTSLLFAQQPAPVQIPDYTVNIRDFGAVADGITLNTQPFERAVAALQKAGGGHLVVPEGLYLTGPITLKDCMDLHLERGAMILFTPDRDLHRDKKGKVRPGISASKRHDVSISGEGIIDGNGAWWRPVKRSKVSDVEWKAFLEKGGTVTDDGSLWYPDSGEKDRLRTHLVRFTDCQRVSVTGVTIQNSPKFHLVPNNCEDVSIEGVTIRCPWNAQNGDGIDIMQSRRVVVRRCSVDVGDDGICLKAGAGEAALKYGPCKDILIEYNTVFHAHGGFVIGSEFSGGMENITVRHNTFSGTDTGLRFKSAPERGGTTRNIRISDIIMNDIQKEAIVFETTYADRPAGHENNQAATTDNFLPDFQDIVMERITCWGARTAIRASGNLQMIHDITVKNAIFHVWSKGTEIDEARMMTFENVSIH